jgi:hypothetical protein
VVHLNRPRTSCFCVVELWPLHTSLPLAWKPSVRPHRPLPPLSWIPSMRPRLPWRPLGCAVALRPLCPCPPLVWEGSMRPLRPLSPLAAGETAMRGSSMWTRRFEPTRGVVVS